jgi:biotin transport system ATP-binding protein
MAGTMGTEQHHGSIRFTQAAVSFGDRVALEPFSVHLDQRRIAVIGANGSGKSTFARLLNGLVSPTSGTVEVHGLDATTDLKQLRRRVGFVFSNPDVQIIMPTVAEDVAFSLRGTELSAAEKTLRVATALAAFGLTEHADAPAHDLSGGQKQLLALCAVLIKDPALVVADEPTALLDARNSRIISDHLLDPAATRQVILVTHDLLLAARCDVAIRFDTGRLVDVGQPSDVIDRYQRDLQ